MVDPATALLLLIGMLLPFVVVFVLAMWGFLAGLRSTAPAHGIQTQLMFVVVPLLLIAVVWTVVQQPGLGTNLRLLPYLCALSGLPSIWWAGVLLATLWKRIRKPSP